MSVNASVLLCPWTRRDTLRIPTLSRPQTSPAHSPHHQPAPSHFIQLSTTERPTAKKTARCPCQSTRMFGMRPTTRVSTSPVTGRTCIAFTITVVCLIFASHTLFPSPPCYQSSVGAMCSQGLSDKNVRRVVPALLHAAVTMYSTATAALTSGYPPPPCSPAPRAEPDLGDAGDMF